MEVPTLRRTTTIENRELASFNPDVLARARVRANFRRELRNSEESALAAANFYGRDRRASRRVSPLSIASVFRNDDDDDAPIRAI